MNGEHDADYNLMKLFEDKDIVKICAPMVRYSKLQFRSLVRQYGCDLCYTPMILADSFCQSAKARNNEFTTNLCDFPLVAQFASSTVHDFVGAANIIAPFCNGVDLNCGCPQRWAKKQGVGCIMLENPELVYDIIRQCRNQISKPFTISVKMRILKDMKKTIEICKRLEKSGISFLSVHGRTPSNINGDIDVEAIKVIRENVSCPIVANGGLKTLEECYEMQGYAKCHGVMVANGILTNPTLFSGSNVTTNDCVQKWINICYNSTITQSLYAQTYKDVVKLKKNPVIPEKPLNLTFQCFQHHLVFMLEKLLPKKTRKIFNNLLTFKDSLQFLRDNLGIVPQLFDTELFNANCILDIRNEDVSFTSGTIPANEYEDYSLYDYKDNDGKFFDYKVKECFNDVEYNLSDIFYESVETKVM